MAQAATAKLSIGGTSQVVVHRHRVTLYLGAGWALGEVCSTYALLGPAIDISLMLKLVKLGGVV